MGIEQPVTRAEVEDFLYHEASLLDAWRLEEWLGLLTDDAEYLVPTPDLPPGAAATTGLALIWDTREQINSRVKHYLNGTVAAETPPSKLRRIITNVRLVEQDGQSISVVANLVVYRFRGERMDTFVGLIHHALVRVGSSLKIRRRRVTLDLESLRIPGMLSIIL